MRHGDWARRLSYGLSLLLAVVGALVSAADRRAGANDGLALARALPKGALAYLQARDFGDLFARWRKSQLANRYYASDSYRAFRRSRLWAKLNERIREFETGVGVTLTENVVAQMAGKASAIALYDMGKLELAFITELSAAQAAATPLLARKSAFETRTTATGQTYLARDLATDGGRLRQGLCVATPPGKLVVTTSEALMQRTLDNLSGTGEDALFSTMAQTLSIADGFAPHDVTLWTDVPRLRKQPYFGYYWVHGAAATELDGIEATLADVEFAGDGVQERRWSLTSGRPVPAAFTPRQQPLAQRLLSVAPFVAVETVKEDAAERVSAVAAQVVFPPLRSMPSAEPPRIRVIEDRFDTGASGGRYQRLDGRFDRDLDDPNAPPLAARPAAARPLDPLEGELAALLRDAQPTLVARLGETSFDNSSPFVTFERAVAIRCGRPFNTKAFEAGLSRAIGQRLFVAGTVPQITWEASATGVASPRAAATALDRCGAYFVSDDVVVIAGSVAYAERLKARLSAATSVQPDVSATAYRQATLRLRALAPGYQRVMRIIGFRGDASLTPLENEPADESIAFFGQNLLSLLAVTEAFDVVTIESAAEAGRVVERVRYRYATSPPTTGE
ncbi:MAG: hypothetical protein CFK52_01650 [Chloracidobacterium sp. CP2_5A]|nr:MAG: hypothetical protein CFK52_01650 [Chloracidobacterium sp. CP2_5A]